MRNRLKLILLFFGLVTHMEVNASSISAMQNQSKPRVTLSHDQLYIDGAAQPFLFGAELQYFRARGGAGRNVEKAEVDALWHKLIDRFVEAEMNTAIFYIPWDFHEPQEGVFDFHGTLDQDHDGKADYPSRNVKGFIDMLVARGITRIMVRPGPYINAEWGPTGFGAIPHWFITKYPEALTGSRTPGRAQTASFGHPTYRGKVARWFRELNDQVLQYYVGEKAPIVFLQIDNESNYFWDSIYERDYSQTSILRFHQFLSKTYSGNLQAIGKAYGNVTISSFSTINAPKDSQDRTYANAWHQDWYAFHDAELRDYYETLKREWQNLGITDEHVLMTSCDSFNAPHYGLLPNLKLRQQNQLSLTTMNVYPKTYGTQTESTMNTPMKAAHDATLVAASHRQFYGAGRDWVMSSETAGGWFPPTEVSLATRQHTYGSLIGSGVKAMIIYYFHEGWNWDGRETSDTPLQFQAPLDKDMNPTSAFDLVKHVGNTLNKGTLGRAILSSVPTRATVLLTQDSEGQYPTPDSPGVIDARSTESAGLFGLFREAGAQPEIGYVDQMSDEDLAGYRLIVWRYEGVASPGIIERVMRFHSRGGHILIVGKKLPWQLEYSPSVTHWQDPIGRDWNSDQYGKLLHAIQTLTATKQLLNESGVEQILNVEPLDEEPYLHAWLRRSPSQQATLLFVENFVRRDRDIRITIGASHLPEAPILKLKQLLVRGPADQVPDEIAVSRSQLARDGVVIKSKSDAVEIWSIEGMP